MNSYLEACLTDSQHMPALHVHYKPMPALHVHNKTYVCLIVCQSSAVLAPEVIKLFSYSTQLSMKFILLINVKMPAIVGILTFISMINTTPDRLKARNFFICRYFSFYEQMKFRAQLS